MIVRVIFLFLLLSHTMVAEEDDHTQQVLSLDEAIYQAFAHNYGLKLQELGLEEGRTLLQEAWGAVLPSVIVDAVARRTPSLSFTETHANTHLVEAIFRQAVLDMAAVNEISVRRYERDARFWDLHAFATELLFSVRRSYYAVILSAEEVIVQQEAVELLEASALRETRRLEAGASTPFQKSQAEATLANARTTLYRAEFDHAIAQNQLMELLGKDCCQEFKFTTAEDSISVLEIELLKEKLQKARPAFPLEERKQWEQRLFNDKADLKRATALWRARGFAVDREKSGYLPRIEWFGGYANRSVQGFNSLLPTGSDYWETGVVARWTLFDGFAREGRICRTAIQQQQASIAWKELRQQLMIRLCNRFEELESALQAYRNAEFSETTAKQGVEEALKRQEVGAITPLEYRDAVQTLSDARLDYLRSGFFLVTAYYGLLADVGAEPQMDDYLCR